MAVWVLSWEEGGLITSPITLLAINEANNIFGGSIGVERLVNSRCFLGTVCKCRGNLLLARFSFRSLAYVYITPILSSNVIYCSGCKHYLYFALILTKLHCPRSDFGIYWMLTILQGRQLLWSFVIFISRFYSTNFVRGTHSLVCRAGQCHGCWPPEH